MKQICLLVLSLACLAVVLCQVHMLVLLMLRAVQRQLLLLRGFGAGNAGAPHHHCLESCHLKSMSLYRLFRAPEPTNRSSLCSQAVLVQSLAHPFIMNPHLWSNWT